VSTTEKTTGAPFVRDDPAVVVAVMVGAAVSTSTLKAELTTVLAAVVLSVALNATVLTPEAKKSEVKIPVLVFANAGGGAAMCQGLVFTLYEMLAIVTAPERPDDTLALVVNVTAPVLEYIHPLVTAGVDFTLMVGDCDTMVIVLVAVFGEAPDRVALAPRVSVDASARLVGRFHWSLPNEARAQVLLPPEAMYGTVEVRLPAEGVRVTWICETNVFVVGLPYWSTRPTHTYSGVIPVARLA